MSAIRTFLAVELPAEIRQKIASVIQALQAAGVRGVRWVAVNNIHLTLKFYGDVSPASLEALKGMIRQEAARCTAFDIAVRGVGTFPSPHRARVLWVGLDAPPALAALQHAVEVNSIPLGYAAEERPFSPHLTIGRVNQHVLPAELDAIAAALQKAGSPLIGSTSVTQITLFRSDLNPGGSIYTPLVHFPFRDQPR
jgi:2'-5' RNA ligase